MDQNSVNKRNVEGVVSPNQRATMAQNGGRFNGRGGRGRRSILPPKLKPVVWGLGLLLAAALAWLFIIAPATLRIEAGKYQALFLTNGEICFGELRDMGPEYMALSDVYYIQSQNGNTQSEDVQGSDAADAQAQLIKLGSEVHGPTDSMLVRKDQILYFENLKDDGQVVKLIEQDKSN